MKEIIINTQEELDKVKVDFDGIIKIVGVGIQIKLRYQYRVEAWENSSVEARGNSSVEARGNSSVVAWENSSVVARENSSVVARENSSVVAWENSSVVAWENSSVKARENSSVEAWENSSVVAWENSSVEAWENSSVEAWGNSSVEARGSVSVRIFTSIKSLCLYGFSVLFIPFDLKFKFKKEETCLVQKVIPQKYLDREGIKSEKGCVILYKRVSKDFLTQEGQQWETKWLIGTTNTHPNWNPKKAECGEGKYHACSRPYFCDEFRNKVDDRYIAIKIKVADLYEWENPSYPHKISFRQGEILYEVDKFGKKIEA